MKEINAFQSCKFGREQFFHNIQQFHRFIIKIWRYFNQSTSWLFIKIGQNMIDQYKCSYSLRLFWLKDSSFYQRNNLSNQFSRNEHIDKSAIHCDFLYPLRNNRRFIEERIVVNLAYAMTDFFQFLHSLYHSSNVYLNQVLTIHKFQYILHVDHPRRGWFSDYRIIHRLVWRRKKNGEL